jgi:hypothetical protein
MTYPNVKTGLVATGIFEEETRDAEAVRERLAAIGMEWFHYCQNQRTGQERQWYLNLAFFYGKQHVQFRSVAGSNAFDLYTPKAPYYRVRIVVNQVRRIIRKEISRLTAQKPNAYVVPASIEDADVFAAQAGEQIWDSLWRRLKFNKTLRSAVFWQAVCGNGFIKSYWDPSKRDPNAKIDVPVGNVNPEDPEADVPTETVPLDGDIVIETVSPFHLFVPDLMCEELEEQPYVIHAQIRSNAWIRQNFGIEVTSEKLESVDQQLQSAMDINRNNTKKDHSTILEIWVKPGYLPELPNGGMFTIAGNQVVQGLTEWPYEHNQYPFAKLDGMPTGKFYNSSIIEDLIPLQKELNRTRAQLIEAKNRMAKPQLVAQEGSVDPRKITTEPGQVVQYKVGFDPPQPLPMQNLPPYVTEEINRLYTDMSDISGQHEVSNGSTPPGVTAATAISFLQEQDESLISTHFTSIEEAIEKIAYQSLVYVHMYWDEPRTVKIVGLEGTFDVRAFKGTDLKGNQDIRVESGSALPTSRAAKQAFLMDLMKMGFIDPQDGLEMMEIGGIQKIYERIQVDKRQAQRENLKMRVVTEEDVAAHNEQWLQNNPEAQKDIDSGLQLNPPLIVSVNTWDNHALHIEMHNNYRKSQAFESASAFTRALFEEHVRQHQEAMAGQMIHPLTGMDPSNPMAPNPDDEDAAVEELENEDSGGEPTGPEPMPELSGEEQA